MGRRRFDPENSQAVSAAMTVLRSDPNVPKDLIKKFNSVLEAEVTTPNGLKVAVNATKQVQHTVVLNTLGSYDILAVRGVDDLFYARPVQNGEPLSEVYEPMEGYDLMNVVTRVYEEATGTVDSNAINNAYESAVKKIRKDNTIERADNTIIQLVSGLYWSTDTGDLTEEVPDGYRCFRRLFNTRRATKHIVKYPDGVMDEYATMIKAAAENTMKKLARHSGDLPDEDFPFITTWACGNHGRYMDIMRMFATFFMKNKPLGTYILEGNGRNGKSSLIGLIHTLMGTYNTSRLQLGELGNWHKNHCLANTMVNAPDEERPGTLEDTDLFRTIADHGDIELDVMRGQKPLTITCDFQCVSASNHMPEWEGTDAEACIRRARIIPLRADLSAEDNKNINFEEETFTPDVMAMFLGEVLGFAKYYMKRDFPESDSVAIQRELLKENMVSYNLFFNSFKSFFGRYQKLRNVYDEYVLWCKHHGYKINKYDEFKEVFNESREHKTSFTTLNLHLPTVYRVSKLEPCFYPELAIRELSGFGTVDDMHQTGMSVIASLEELRDRDIREFNGGENE